MAIPSVTSIVSAGRLGPGTITLAPGAGTNWLAFVHRVFSGSTPAAPSGWTLINTAISTGNDTYLLIYMSTGSPSSTWNITTNSGYPTSIVIVGYNATLTQRNLTSASSATSPSVTTTFADCIIVTAVSDGNDAITALGYPSNRTLGRGQKVTPIASNAWSSSVGVAHSSQAAAGASGTSVWTIPSAYQPVTTTLAFTGEVAGENYSGSVALDGSGLLVVSGVALHTAEGSVDFSGSGTLETENAGLNITQDIALSATGTLTVEGVPALVSAVDLSGSGTLSVTGDRLQEESGSVDLSSSGSLVVDGVSNPASDISLSGTGTLSVEGFSNINGAVSLGGTARLQVRDFTKAGPGLWTRADDELDFLENTTGVIGKTLADLRHLYWKSILLKERTNNDLEKEFQELRLNVLYNQYTLGDLQAVDPKYYQEDDL